MSYFGQQPAYGPLPGPRLATKEQIEDYRSEKRKNNTLIIVLVVIVILLIAAIIAVFTIAFMPRSDSDDSPTVIQTVTIAFDAVNSGINYGTEHDSTSKTAFIDVQQSICITVQNAASTFTISECKATVMSLPTGSTTGILAKMQMKVAIGTRTEDQTVAQVGALIIGVASPLSIQATSIKKV